MNMMLTNVPTTFSVSEMCTVAQSLLDYIHAHKCRIVALHGTLGAGKTTLTQACLRALGVQGVITSPTFTYVNVYEIPAGLTIYHFDLYRIKTLQDFEGAGFDEYLYAPNSFCFIEWPEVIAPLLKDRVCQVVLEHVADEKRSIAIITSAHNN